MLWCEVGTVTYAFLDLTVWLRFQNGMSWCVLILGMAGWLYYTGVFGQKKLALHRLDLNGSEAPV